MTLQAISFVAGVLSRHLCDILPVVSSLLAGVIAVPMLFSPRCRLLAIYLLGFSWAAVHGSPCLLYTSDAADDYFWV